MSHTQCHSHTHTHRLTAWLLFIFPPCDDKQRAKLTQQPFFNDIITTGTFKWAANTNSSMSACNKRSINYCISKYIRMKLWRFLESQCTEKFPDWGYWTKVLGSNRWFIYFSGHVCLSKLRNIFYRLKWKWMTFSFDDTFVVTCKALFTWIGILNSSIILYLQQIIIMCKSGDIK